MMTVHYIPEYVPSDLKWCKRNGLLTLYDQLNDKRVLEKPVKWVKNHEVTNFNIFKIRLKDEAMSKYKTEYKILMFNVIPQKLKNHC